MDNLRKMTQNLAKKIDVSEIKKDSPEISINVVDEGYARGAPIPWRLKLALKITLAAMPLSYKFLSRLGIFKHGDLEQSLPSLFKGFQEQIEYYKKEYSKVPEYCLELGPGDSIGHALQANAHGCKGLWLNDVDDFATNDPEHYASFHRFIKQKIDTEADQGAPHDYERNSVLEFANAKYGTEGLKSLKTVPTGKIDFSYSNAVWEHIARDEFQDHMNELYRVHKSGSMSRHYVDLHDHLGGALNNFCFSPKFWEGGAVRNAGFYTNRLTMEEMANHARNAGFEVETPLVNKWKTLPTKKEKMHPSFHEKSEKELNVCTFLIILKKP